MSATLILKKKPPKNKKNHFLKGSLFIMGGPTDMMLACFERLL